MAEQGYGRLVLVSSQSGIFGNPVRSNYGAAKTGLIGLMNVIAQEAPSGIAVNCLFPNAAGGRLGGTPLAERPDKDFLIAAGERSAHYADGLKPEFVAAMACYLAKSHYGKPDAKEWKEIALGGIRFPAGGKAAVDQHLKSAHALIYRRYDALRTERWFSWDLTADVALYDFPDNEEVCAKTLDPYKARWVGVKDSDGAWRPLTQGIPPHALGYTTGGPPTHFDFRQCIQIWPAPTTTEGQLVIRGHFNPEAFAADGDTPTVDDELVYLLALAQAKTQYQQPDAQLYMAQFEVHLGKLISGTHGVRRYIPGVNVEPDYIYTAPVPSVPFA